MILAGYSAGEDSSDHDGDDDDDDDGDEDDGYIISADTSGIVGGGMGGAKGGSDHAEEEFVYEVLSSEQIVEHMADCIKDVNTVVQACQFVYILHRHTSVLQCLLCV